MTVIGAALPVLPLRWIFRRAAPETDDAPTCTLSAEQERHAKDIGWSVRSAAYLLPWHPVCLPQSLTALAMLKRRQVPATLYLGLRLSADTSRRLQAHAWVRAGDVAVTPAQKAMHFRVVARFGSG